MIKQLLILFALAFAVAATGITYAQTATMSPTMTPAPTATSMPAGAPNTGFGTLVR